MAPERQGSSKKNGRGAMGPRLAISSSPGSGLREFLNGIFYGYRLLLVTVTLPIVMAILLSTTLTTIFTSQSKLLVLLSRQHVLGDGMTTAGFGGSLDMQSRIVKAESEILVGRKLRFAVVEHIGVQNLYPKIVENMIYMPRELIVQVAADRLFRDLTIDLSSSSDIMNLQFQHTDSNIAASTLNTIVDFYLQHRAYIFSNDGNKVLTTRLENFEKEMASIDYRIEVQRVELDIFDFTTEKISLLKRRALLSNQQLTTEVKMGGLEARVAELGMLKGLIPEEVDVGGSDDGAINALTSAINVRNNLLLKRTELANTYSLDSRFIREIDTRIERAQKSVVELEELELERQRTGRNTTYDRVIFELITLQAQQRQELAIWDGQNIAIEKTNEELSILEVEEVQFNQLMLERSVLLEKIKTYEIRLEKERVATMLEEQHEDPTIRILERALPDLEGRNARFQVLAVGVVFGLVLSLAVVYLTSISRTVMVTPEEAERTLEIPVLISISSKI